MSENKTKRKISIAELVLYIIAVWGLTYIILGLLARFLPLPESTNPLKLADDTIRKLFGLGYLGWGLILFGVFAVAGVIIMLVFAKDVDRNFEQNKRREARLQRNKTVAVTTNNETK